LSKGIALGIAGLLAGLLILSTAQGETGWEEAFFRANQAYQTGHFQEAIEGYLGLIEIGVDGGPVYYNLGNAYLKGGQIGHAIWAYERGRLFSPRDADLRFNLSHARNQTRDAIEDPGGSVETVFFWLKSFNLLELFGCFAVLNLLLWSILAVRLFNRSEGLYYVFLVTLSLWFVAGLSFGLQYYRLATDDRAVVIEKEVPILAGPDTADTVLFKLHEGAMARHERSEGGWALVRISDKNRGWVRAAAIRRILNGAGTGE